MTKISINVVLISITFKSSEETVNNHIDWKESATLTEKKAQFVM